jgi:hypothetical protein
MTESPEPTTPVTGRRLRRLRSHLGFSRTTWLLARTLLLTGLIVWAATPFDLRLLTAFAEPAGQSGYATPTPGSGWYTATQYPYPANANPYGADTATWTPTPYANGTGQYPNNQYPNNGSVNQTGTGYQGASVTDPNNPYSGGVPAQGGQPGSSISSGAIQPGPGGAAPSPGTGSDPCYGDELITFAPEAPRVGDELLIAVTSARPHPYGRLAGTENTQFVRERPGQRGYVWEWTIHPTYPGQHEYTFYVDSTIPCQKVQLTVRESLATKTPRPTKTPTPYGWNNNDNSNNNNDNNQTSSGSPPYRDPSQFVNSGDAYDCSFFYSQGEAQRVLRANPSDPNNLDVEDGVTDGIACTTYHNWQYPNDGDYNPVQRNGAATPTPGSYNVSPYLGQGDRYGCRDFSSQALAQAVLRADPSDPNRLDENPRNGVACEYSEALQDGVVNGAMPQPYDDNPVSR